MHFLMLDLLRGFAALWVFTYHYQFSDSFRASFPAVHEFLKLGHLGVPMFFVISGYCINASAQSVIRRNGSSGQFLYRRLRRIFPPYWYSVAVVATIPFVIAMVSAFRSGELLVPDASQSLNYGYLDYTPFEWLRLLTLTQVFWPVPGATELSFKFTTINAVYWTLAIEVQFYLAISAILWLWRQHFYKAVLLSSVACLPLSFSGQLNLSGLFLPWWPMFSLGILLSYVLERGWAPNQLPDGHRKEMIVDASIAGVAAWGAAAYCGYRVDSWSFAVCFTAALWLLKPFDPLFVRLRESRYLTPLFAPAMTLGSMSYSLYLLHGSLQFLTAMLVRQFLPAGGLYDCVTIGCTVLACWPFYVWCEAPFARTPMPVPAVPAGDAAPLVAPRPAAGHCCPVSLPIRMQSLENRHSSAESLQACSQSAMPITVHVTTRRFSGKPI